jgi:phage shock protein A
MALLERVTTLIRANLNDLMDKAEDPAKVIKQVILDMENQLIQVKTQVAVALTDQHVLEKKRKEIERKAAEWMQKAEMAVDKGKDDLARAALERAMAHQKMGASLKEQEADQLAQAEIMKSSLKRLGEKLAEAHAKRDLLIAQRRRTRLVDSVDDAQVLAGESSLHPDSTRHTEAELVRDDVEDKFALMEKEDQINKLLSELKARRRPNS